MNHSRRLGILGGTFDPIHLGHLDAADAARAALSLDEVLFMPSHDPPHRPTDPRATSFHRFALVALAIEGRSGCRASDIELRRTGPSYTVATLRELHAEGWQPSQLFFILGTDAFAEIATWHEYPAVLACATFVVITRPGSVLPGDPGPAAGNGLPGIVFVEARTRDVSSTAVRARLAAGQRVDELLPAAVAGHIFAHQLYGATGDRHG
jgi:nicotinate-nucleotide adenylyltransferase